MIHVYMINLREGSNAVDTDQQLQFESIDYSQSFSGTRKMKECMMHKWTCNRHYNFRFLSLPSCRFPFKRSQNLSEECLHVPTIVHVRLHQRVLWKFDSQFFMFSFKKCFIESTHETQEMPSRLPWRQSVDWYLCLSCCWLPLLIHYTSQQRYNHLLHYNTRLH